MNSCIFEIRKKFVTSVISLIELQFIYHFTQLRLSLYQELSKTIKNVRFEPNRENRRQSRVLVCRYKIILCISFRFRNVWATQIGMNHFKQRDYLLLWHLWVIGSISSKFRASRAIFGFTDLPMFMISTQFWDVIWSIPLQLPRPSYSVHVVRSMKSAAFSICVIPSLKWVSDLKPVAYRVLRQRIFMRF